MASGNSSTDAVAARLQNMKAAFVQADMQSAFWTGGAPGSASSYERIVSALMRAVLVPGDLSGGGVLATKLVNSNWEPEDFEYDAETAGVSFQAFAGTKVEGATAWRLRARAFSKLDDETRSFLHDARTLYMLLRDDNMRRIQGDSSSDPLVLDSHYGAAPEVVGTGLRAKLAAGVSAELRAILDFARLDTTATNTFALRRLLLLYELLVYFFIALKMVERSAGDDDARAASLFHSLASSLAVLESPSGPGFTALTTRVSDRMRDLSGTVDDITKMDAQMKDVKVYLAAEMERLRVGEGAAKHTRALEKASIALVVVATALAAYVLVPTPGRAPGDHVRNAGAFLAFAATAYLGLRAAWARWGGPGAQAEHFFAGAVDGVDPNPTSSAVVAQDAKTAQLASMASTAGNKIVGYLEKTLSLGLILQAYQAYGSASHAVEKERAYYSGRAVELANARSQAKQGVAVETLAHYNRSIKVNLALSLLLILVAAVGASLVWTSPRGRAAIAATALVLALGAAAAGAVDSTFRVRTDGKKFYWAQPDTTAL